MGLRTRWGRVSVPVPGGPLPVELVVDDVAVHQQVQEVPGADPPVHVQRLRQETRRQQACPVVHPALVPQLAHGRVDDRIAGAPLPPRGDVLGGVVLAAPAVVAGAVVPPGRLGARRQHLMVEVPPAQLTHERVRARTSLPAGPVDGLRRGERPEVEVRRQPRRGVPREVVVPVLVGGHASRARPPRQPLPAGRLPSRRETGEVPDTSARSGSGSPRTPSGTRTARGAASGVRRVSWDQRRRYGVNTP